jgi:hypothetical protein
MPDLLPKDEDAAEAVVASLVEDVRRPATKSPIARWFRAGFERPTALCVGLLTLPAGAPGGFFVGAVLLRAAPGPTPSRYHASLCRSHHSRAAVNPIFTLSLIRALTELKLSTVEVFFLVRLQPPSRAAFPLRSQITIGAPPLGPSERLHGLGYFPSVAISYTLSLPCPVRITQAVLARA